MRHDIFHTVPAGAPFTGHLHTLPTREAAERWLPVLASQGFSDLRIVELADRPKCSVCGGHGHASMMSPGSSLAPCPVCN